jgi:hypothetical protein
VCLCNHVALGSWQRAGASRCVTRSSQTITVRLQRPVDSRGAEWVSPLRDWETCLLPLLSRSSVSGDLVIRQGVRFVVAGLDRATLRRNVVPADWELMVPGIRLLIVSRAVFVFTS